MMKLDDALKWADDNSQPEATKRLRSRSVAQTLEFHVRSYREWIKEHGKVNYTCTWEILGEICEGCECKRKPSDEEDAL